MAEKMSYLCAMSVILKVATADRCIRRVQNLITTHILPGTHSDRHTVAAATAERVEVIRAITLELQRNGVGEAVGGLEQLHGYLHSI